MPNIGPMEIAIVLIIALVVFGPKRLPDLGHSLGKGIREFKGSISGESEELSPQVTPQQVEVKAESETTHVA
jgi:sec-independent protein translocase protein TatA